MPSAAELHKTIVYGNLIDLSLKNITGMKKMKNHNRR